MIEPALELLGVEAPGHIGVMSVVRSRENRALSWPRVPFACEPLRFGGEGVHEGELLPPVLCISW